MKDLKDIKSPADIRQCSVEELEQLIVLVEAIGILVEVTDTNVLEALV